MECNGNCNNCGNTECEWYDDFLDQEQVKIYDAYYNKGVADNKKTLDKLLDETLNEFMTCPGGNSCFIIDGKEYHTDTGYAIEGIQFFVERLKSKIHS